MQFVKESIIYSALCDFFDTRIVMDLNLAWMDLIFLAVTIPELGDK